MDNATIAAIARWRVSAHAEVFTQVMEIELTGHKGYGASIMCEVDFTQTPVTPAQTYGDPEYCYPAEGGETEIVAVRPFECTLDPTTGRAGTRRNYLACPPCWEALLVDCIDPSGLVADRG
jgi:hypothetical protein